MKKILVADDEPYVLRFIEYTLCKAGYNVTTAVDGEEALNKIKSENPDLVFLDIQMPKMDGNEVCKQLRLDPAKKDLYVIVITAKGQESERIFSLECGASEYITKPYSPRRMLEPVKEILENDMASEIHDLKGLLDVVSVHGMLAVYADMVPSIWQIRQDDGTVVVEAGSLPAAVAGARLSRLERAAVHNTDGLTIQPDGDASVVEVQVPIKHRDRLLGALHVQAEASHINTPHLQQLAHRVAQVVEAWAADKFEVKNLVGELVLRYEELSVLYDASETIVSNMDLEEVSRLILTKAKEILDVKTASLMLVDQETGTLRVKDALGLNQDLVKEIRLKIGEEISGWVAREGKPLLIEDIEQHGLFRQVNKERYATRSLLSVPLKIKDRVIGVLNVNNKETGEVFNSGDLKLLAALGSLAAISIENATTYKNAITDRLTRLYNYGYFREQLYKKVAQCKQENEGMTLLMFDIDHFKYFNDRNGHELGNVCLVGVANICMDNCRQKGDRMPDLVARYGGEEFLILLYGVPKEQAAGTAERIRFAIETMKFQGGDNQPMGKVTISVGVAACPGDADNGDDLINAADQALYRAKRGGRNQVQLA